MGRQSHLQPRSLASLRLRARRIEGGDAHPSPPLFPLARRSLSLCDQFCDVPDSNQPPPFVPSLTSACNYAPATVSSRYFLFLFHYFRFQTSPSVTSPTQPVLSPIAFWSCYFFFLFVIYFAEHLHLIRVLPQPVRKVPMSLHLLLLLLLIPFLYFLFPNVSIRTVFHHSLF